VQESKVVVCSYPTLQKHNSHSGLSLPLTEVELPGHTTHDALEIAATVEPYAFPHTQRAGYRTSCRFVTAFSQETEPDEDVSVPSSHSVHPEDPAAA